MINELRIRAIFYEQFDDLTFTSRLKYSSPKRAVAMIILSINFRRFTQKIAYETSMLICNSIVKRGPTI